MPDDLTAQLAEWGEDFEEELNRAFAEDDKSLKRSLSLLAAVEAALGRHVEAVIEDMKPVPFHYCKTCSGHPAWPCPEVAAITTALTGEDEQP